MANSALKDMNMPEALDETFVEFPDNRLLIELCGEFDRNLAAFEQGFGVVIMRRGNQLALHGPGDQRERAVSGLRTLYQELESGRPIEQGDIEAVIRLGTLPAEGPVEVSLAEDATVRYRAIDAVGNQTAVRAVRFEAAQ